MRDYCVNITIDLVFESHHTSRLFYRRYELTNLSTFLFSTFPIGHKHPPSIFTLHDFVVGPFLRWLCDLPFYTFGFVSSRDLDSLLWEITNQCYDRFIFNITIDSYSTLREIHIQHYERFSIWITPHTSRLFYRRYELTNLSTFLFSTFPIGHTHPRPSLLSATSSPLSPVYSDGGGSAPNDGHLCLLYTSLLVDKHPPSIFTLHDFVVAFAGLFWRRLCDPPPIIYYPEMAHITSIESYYALLMLSLFSFSNFFMISPISFISNKIETHFVHSYISHRRISNVIRLVLAKL